MKKTFAIFALCLLVLLGGVIAVVTALHDDRDDIVVTAHDRTGDRSAAQGFTAQQSVRRGGHLLWDLTMDLGSPEESQTEFTYVKEDMGFPDQTMPDAISIMPPTSWASVADLDHLPAHFEAMAQDIASRTPEGETRTETILLSDYWDCYPLSVGLVTDDTSVTQEDYARDAAFTDFFRFPVLPGDTLEITVDPRPDAMWQFSTQPDSTGMAFHVNSVMADETIFFSFRPGAWPFPSFENVPGGYGLYRLDLTDGREDLNSLACIYPLPDGTFILDLALTPDGSRLVMTTGNALGYACTVLDPETLEELQTFDLPMTPPTISTTYTLDKEGNRSSYPYYYFEVFGSLVSQDTFLLLGYDDIHLYLWKDGAYTHQFSVSTEDFHLQAIRPGCESLWNGEKLAIASTDGGPGLDLWVLDDQGTLLYRGQYVTSLEEDVETDPEDMEYWKNTFYLLEGAELTLGWTG